MQRLNEEFDKIIIFFETIFNNIAKETIVQILPL